MYVARDVVLVFAFIVMLLAGRAQGKRAAIAITALLIFIGWLTLVAMANDLSLPVAASGIRSYVAPFFLVVFVAAFANGDLTLPVTRTLVAWAPIEAILTVIQSGSPADARINVSLNDASAHFVDFGLVRSTGTFTAPAGLTVYVVMAVAASLVLAFTSRERSSRLVGLLGIVSCAVIVALGASRGAVLGAVIVIAEFLVVALARGHGKATRALAATTAVVGLSVFAIVLMFPDRVNAFASRFHDAAESEDSGTRLVSQLTSFPAYLTSILGDGPGVHSQVGIASGSGAVWIEDDSAKWVAELGLLGFVFAVLRLLTVVAAIAVPLLRARTIGVAAATYLAALGATQIVSQITQTPTHQAAFGILLATLVSMRLGQPDSGSAPDALPQPGHSSRRRGTLTSVRHAASEVDT
jgi:hypothetical protein